MLRIIFFCLILISTYNLKAQISFGIKAGININKSKDSGIDNLTENRIGYQIGGLVGFNLSEKFSLDIEPQYISKGFSFNGGNADIGYIEFPIILSYSLVKPVSIELGPAFGFKVSTKIKTDTGVDISKDYDGGETEFGLNVGILFSFTKRLKTSLRYYHGFTETKTVTELFFLQNGINTGSTKPHNENFQINLFYTIFGR